MLVLRDQLDIALGSVLVFIGLCGFAIALIRRRKEDRILVWFGLFSGIYGTRMLLRATPGRRSIIPTRQAHPR
jgi:uncharacterized membrane protein YeiB